MLSIRQTKDGNEERMRFSVASLGHGELVQVSTLGVGGIDD